MFFFASYEGVRLVQGNVVNAQVPTAAMKAGNLSASPTNIYDPLTGAANGTGRTPFADKMIPANRIDPGIKAMLDTGAWANPNQAGSGAFGLSRNFQCLGCQGNSGARRDQIDGKFNWNPNSKLSTYVRAGYNNGDWYNPVISDCSADQWSVRLTFRQASVRRKFGTTRSRRAISSARRCCW